MVIYPLGEVSSLEILSTRVTAANAFRVGNLVAYVAAEPDKWVLATNLTSGYRAVGWIASSSPSDFRLITTSGDVVRWPQHGLGADGTRLWLGVDGGYVTSEPSDPSVVNVQEVGAVLDANTLVIRFPNEKDLNEGAPADATYIVGSSTLTLSSELVLKDAIIMSGLLAARPAASAVPGALYYVEDSGSARWTRAKNDGSGWEDKGIDYSKVTNTPTSLPPSGSAGGDLSGTYPNPSVVDDSHAHTASTLSGVAPPGASFITVAAESELTAEVVLAVAVIMRGLIASRPAASVVPGALYFVTDSGSARWTRAKTDGSGWEDCGIDFSQVLNTGVVALLGGRAGGQTEAGGTASGESLTLTSTAHATKGFVYFTSSQEVAVDEVNVRVGIGDATPDCALDINKTADGVLEARVDNASTGTAADARVTVACNTNGSRAQLIAFGSGHTGTLAGITLTNWQALVGLNGSGLLIETVPAAPVVIGTGNVEAARYDTSGNHILARAGAGYRIKEGSNARMGVATLAAGTIVVSNASVTANTRIFVSRSTAGGTLGHLSYIISAGASFTINSSSATDTSTVNWLLIEPS